MNDTLPWHDQVDQLGVRIRAHFFDPAEVNARTDFVARQLPILPPGDTHLLVPEGQREGYRVAGLLAYPDAVLVHGNGLLCLTHRASDERLQDITRWRQHWRADVMLQCLAMAMAVSGQRQQPVAAMWRGANLLCQFDPSPAVLECMASQIGAAQKYWGEPQQISPSQLVSFCEARLRALPGLSSPDRMMA